MEYWNFTPVSIIYFISAAISFLLVYFGFKLRPVKGAVLFSLMMFFVGLWVSAALIEFFNDKFEVMIIMIKIEYTAMAGASIFWLLFTSVYTNSDKWLKPWVYILIIIIPLITLYNIYQAPNETYIHETYEIVTIKGITIFKRNFANGFFIWTAFAYTMLLSGFIIVVVSIIKSSLTFKRQLIYLTPIIFIVLIPNLFFITGNNFIDPYDPTPLALLLVCILFLITMYQHKFLNISPVAHDLVFRNVKSAVIVIDIQGRIVEINPAGELILETANERYIGKELKQYLPEPVSLISESVGKSEIKAELTLGQDKRNYEVQITALENSSGLIRGHVILLWDITEQKMALFELDAYARSVA
ncbi:MAG: PAS domain-containing protein, partial [Bacteroidales bacterium]|nr:PAS domain-containing protein [Bacteroidales bacterium]